MIDERIQALQKPIEEDEIDLRELFRTIWSRKRFVIGFTLVITLLAVAYTLLKTPIYEAKVILEMGYFKKDGQKDFIDDSARLAQELNVIFIDSVKSANGEKNAFITSVNVLKGNKDFIQVSAEGISNKAATQEVKDLITYTQKKHQKIIDERVKDIEIQLKDVDRQIGLLKSNSLQAAEEKIVMLQDYNITLHDEQVGILEGDLEEYQAQLELTKKNITRTARKDPALSALSIMDKRDLETRISEIKLEMIELKKQKEEMLKVALPQLLRDKDKIVNIDLVQLQEKREFLELAIAPYNYQNTQVVGRILFNDYPVKPKKKLIVTIAFVTGFILAIFLVFFMEFVKGFKEEEK